MIEWERVNVAFDIFATPTWACSLCGSLVAEPHRQHHEEWHFPPLQPDEDGGAAPT